MYRTATGLCYILPFYIDYLNLGANQKNRKGHTPHIFDAGRVGLGEGVEVGKVAAKYDVTPARSFINR